ncbi:hypothetical protein GCM10010203_34130 [Actinomadura yumaensis]
MLLKLRTDNGEQVSVTLKRQSESENVWRSLPDGPAIEVVQHPDGRLSTTTTPTLDLLKESIEEQFLELLAGAALQEAGGIEFSEEQEGTSLDDDPFPYDPETIRVDTKPFNISLVNDMIADGDINLSPDFQRGFVWTDLGARSRLIESIMLRIPLPVFYMAQEKSGRLQVVDGLQRLTVIRQFLNNELRLRDLEYLSDEEGKVFRHEDESKCIDQRYRKRILQTQIMINIIDSQTPADVKFDIFKRINQGGRPLNAQEIRNCMSLPTTRQAITQLSRSEDFLSATCGSVGTVRMQDQELALRFLAFRMANIGLMEPYLGNMDRFLDHAIDRLNNSSSSVIEGLSSDFFRAMKNSAHLFGQFAFRKCLPHDLIPGARRRLINNALFTTWATTLAEYSDQAVKLQTQGSFAIRLADSLQQDPQFLDCVTSGTNDRRRLSYSFSIARRLCEENIL